MINPEQQKPEKDVEDVLPPSVDYLDAPGCEVVLQNTPHSPVTASRLAAILFRLGSKNPEPKVDFWIKIHH